MAAEFNFSNDFLAAQRKLGDDPADDFINRCFADSALKKGLQTWLSQLNVNQDLDQIPHQFNQEDFLQNGFKLPEWADPKVMQAGSAFFTSCRANYAIVRLALSSVLLRYRGWGHGSVSVGALKK